MSVKSVKYTKIDSVAQDSGAQDSGAQNSDIANLGLPMSFKISIDNASNGVKSFVSTHLETMSFTSTIIAIIVLFVGWLIAIPIMIYYYIIISTYKNDPNSGSKLFKTIYAICHCIISVILLLYVFVKIYIFHNRHLKDGEHMKEKDAANMEGGSKGMDVKQDVKPYDNTFIWFLTSIPLNIRKEITKSMNKFENLDYLGDKYVKQIDLSIMLRLVAAQFPIIIFLIVFTSIVSMIKAYHKILCGNAKLDLIIDWPYRIIDIVMYAIFRIVGVIVAFMNFRYPDSPLTYIMPIFYFTAIYLIIRFILLLYENLFSDTIISLYKWDIRETDCNTNNSDMSGNWILDPNARKQVKDRQNLADSNKLTNDVFSLIFNILIILFLSGISIMSVCLLLIYSGQEPLKTISIITNNIGHKTVNPPPVSVGKSEGSPSETAKQ